MDPALLKEREAFKKRALAQPSVEKRKAQKRTENDRSTKKARPAPKPKADFNYKAMQGSSQFKFGILAKIVKYMKQRHQQGDTYPLSIDDILDETNQLDVGARHKQWLSTEALVNNPKINVVDDNKFVFRPKYNIRDRRGLMRLLERNDLKGLGGVLMDDVEEAVPKCGRVIQQLGSQITKITRPADKKEVLFYNDKSFDFTVDEEFIKLWRGVSVDGVDENKIDEYLDQRGITTMQDVGAKTAAPVQKRKRKGGNRKKTFKSHNDHLGNLLEDYSNVDK
ncbi:transcription initiation factor IIE subunit beta-like [Lineus longissimus]|uniref:transcription initiation factor IIE subunit beta-like n=1 Tax=Lineus longissimus TaxID=88925 RepID=UPI00315C59B7